MSSTRSATASCTSSTKARSASLVSLPYIPMDAFIDQQDEGSSDISQQRASRVLGSLLHAELLRLVVIDS